MGLANLASTSWFCEVSNSNNGLILLIRSVKYQIEQFILIVLKISTKRIAT